MPNVPDAIDELVARSKDCLELRTFHEFHKAHPEVLDFLTEEIQLRLDHGFRAFSYRSLWEYCRWKLSRRTKPGATFELNDHASLFYSRAVTILHPEFNRRCEFRAAKVDEIFGVELEPIPEKRPRFYARGLQWVDGTSLEAGWRPSSPHVAGHVTNRRLDIHAGRDATRGQQ